MLSRACLFLLLCNIVVAIHAQNDSTPSLNIGSPAPPLRVKEWLKGKPIQGFEKGKIYVVDFWATWCGPCLEEMPRLSELARTYKSKVTFIGMNVYERKPLSQVKAFVDSLGHWMNFSIAAQDSNFMETGWMDAVGESSIPTSFVINADGKLAWIGYTTNLPGPLSKIVDNNWDLNTAVAERNLNKHLAPLDRETFHEAGKYTSNAYMKDFFGEPDSALLLIDNMIAKDPELKYGYFIAFSTLYALLRTNSHKAYEYAKELMSYKEPNYEAIIGTLKDYPYQYNSLPKEIFELGAEACQAEIDLYPWTTKTAENYYRMAEWYLRANNKLKARQAMRKAIKVLKRKKRKYYERAI